MRLDRYLANAGVGTRQEVKKLIKKGFISVNQTVITKADYAVNLETDMVLLEETEIKYQAFVYLVLHKPSGYLSAKEDRREKTVMELIEGYEHRDLHLVGRLDKDTTGLLLLTDDGQFTHHITSPKHHIAKHYVVTLDKPFDLDHLKKLEAPMVIDGEETQPAVAKLQDKNILELTIFEGKHHQVKRMVERLGYKVIHLHRDAIGTLTLEGVKLGAFRELTTNEVAELKLM